MFARHLVGYGLLSAGAIMCLAGTGLHMAAWFGAPRNEVRDASGWPRLTRGGYWLRNLGCAMVVVALILVVIGAALAFAVR
ncbi:MAG TPA: hypothetical protein VN541_03110 [Tepidisphaeraceae bacterium]|nr:hypothetical protein [Tepidisphaeraceae bacterium]